MESVKVPVWITNDYLSPDQLQLMTQEELASELKCYSKNDMTQVGWVKAGYATISITLEDMEGLVENKIQALKAEKKKAEADHYVRMSQFDDKINNLLAITYKPETPVFDAEAK